MRRLGAIFIATCMVLIAGAAGAVLYLAVGLAAAESILAGLLVLCTLAIYNIVTRRWRDHVNIGAQIANLSRGTSDLAIRVGELGPPRRPAGIPRRELRLDRELDTPARQIPVHRSPGRIRAGRTLREPAPCRPIRAR